MEEITHLYLGNFEGKPQTFTQFKFPGGECHVKISPSATITGKIRLHCRLNSSDDFMMLCLAVDSLRHIDVSAIEVHIPYIPYARQDRVMIPGEPLSIKVFARLLNSLNLQKVYTYDAHSEVSVALIENCQNSKNFEMVKNLLERLDLNDYYLVSPDLGAYKKISQLAQFLGYDKDLITGIKVRNLATGEILKTEIDKADAEGKPCIIIDDICDGGRTFMELAKVLKERNAGNLYLIVSHGIFSHDALTKLQDTGFTAVCSSNSIQNREETMFFKQFDLFS